MTFRPEDAEQFIQIFSESVPLIKSFEGCHGVKLMQDAGNEAVYFTLSKWQSDDHLNSYRSSDLFRMTWAKVKPLFSEKAEAWSLVEKILIP